MGRTSIEWADLTWNPGVFGCTEVSPACAHCYAAKMAHRLTAMGRYPDGITVARASGVHWTGQVEVAPSISTRGLPRRGPARVFTTSMADLFHDAVPVDFLDEVFRVICGRDTLTFLILTKRTDRMLRYVQRRIELGLVPWPANAWAGATVEDQRRADERCPDLALMPAPIRFLSMEPLLGRTDVSLWLRDIGWVIAGGESGPAARPTHPDWLRSVRDQCVGAGVPFFLKQWGEWAPATREDRRGPSVMLRQDGSRIGVCDAFDPVAGDALLVRRGRSATGRELDGRSWDEVPS